MVAARIVLALGLLCSIQSARADGLAEGRSLCRTDEAVVFSCPIRRDARTVSLCLLGEKLTYRFGKPSAIELEYPDDSSTAIEAFQRTQSQLPGSGPDEAQLSSDQRVAFRRRGLRYLLHHHLRRDGETGSVAQTATLTLDRGSNRLARHRCGAAILAHWSLLDGKPFRAVAPP